MSILAEDSRGEKTLSSLTFNMTLQLYREATTQKQLDNMTWWVAKTVITRENLYFNSFSREHSFTLELKAIILSFFARAL